MTYKEVRDIWVKACLYEYKIPIITADVDNGGTTLDRVALEYFRAREEDGFSHENALTVARSYAREIYTPTGMVGNSNPSDEEIMERVEKAKLFVKSREKRQAVYFYDDLGGDAGELYYPHPDQLIWKPA